MTVTLVIMARAPQPGRSKTRLIPQLGEDGAARLQKWLLQQTLETAKQADIGPIRLYRDGELSEPELVTWLGQAGIFCYPQAEGDLGQRMHAAIQHAAADACTRSVTASGGILLIGSDCPALTASHLQLAAAGLRAHDAVVTPAEDGGYVLIGLRRPEARLFADIDWGSSQVMATTRQRLQQLQWRWQEMPSLWDVDRQEDYQRLTALHPEVIVAVGK